MAKVAAHGPWHYRRDAGGLFEWGDVEGRDVALPAHVHAEDQVTFVLAGRRRFRIEDEVVVLGPGRILALPSGTVHLSLAEPDGVLCRNLYLPAGAFDLRAWIAAVSGTWRRVGDFDEAGLIDRLADYQFASSGRRARPDAEPLEVRRSIARTAARLGMSREHFSRVCRRDHGLPPSRLRALVRLNAARALLRQGSSPADAAAEAGFADQSHLGREFRRAFGVTPARYRAG